MKKKKKTVFKVLYKEKDCRQMKERSIAVLLSELAGWCRFDDNDFPR